jgi:hypothetical protein
MSTVCCDLDVLRTNLLRSVNVRNLVGVYTSEVLVNFTVYPRPLFHVATGCSALNGWIGE